MIVHDLRLLKLQPTIRQGVQRGEIGIQNLNRLLRAFLLGVLNNAITYFFRRSHGETEVADFFRSAYARLDELFHSIFQISCLPCARRSYDNVSMHLSYFLK